MDLCVAPNAYGEILIPFAKILRLCIFRFIEMLPLLTVMISSVSISVNYSSLQQSASLLFESLLFSL